MARQFFAGLAFGAITVLAWHAWPGTELPAATESVASLDRQALSAVHHVPPAARDVEPLSIGATEQSAGSTTGVNGVRVDVRADTLSVSGRGATLRSILDDITLQSGITFHNVTTLRDEPVTTELDAVPLEAGLRTLLAGYDAFIYYESAAPNAAPQTVWIYAVGAGRDLTPVANTTTVDSITPAAEPFLDVDALLSQADTTSNEAQRVDALQRVIDAGVVPPRDWLERVLQNDRADAMRLTAFRTLTQSSDLDTTDIRAVADLALSDPNDELRAEAQQLLSDMNTTALRRAPDQERASSN